MGPLYCGKRIQNPIQGNTSSFKRPHFLPANQRARIGKRCQQSPTKDGSRGNSCGISRILHKTISCSKKEWKNEAHNKSFHSKQICSNTKLQNGNSEKSQKFNSPQLMAFLLDLTDAYLHVSIYPASCKYLQFSLKDKIFQFRALPFGLSMSPYVFTYLKKVIASHLHRKAITLYPYLDDWLSRNQNCLALLKHRQFIIHLIVKLGLIINQEKSELIPSHKGWNFSLASTVKIPQDRIQALLETISLFLPKITVTARLFLSLLGKPTAAADFVILGRLHPRPLQMSLLAQWRPHILLLHHQIMITHNIWYHLNWRNNHQINLKDVPIKNPLPSHQLFTDASQTCSGAHLEPEGLLFRGVWTQDQSQFHISLLEMMAITLVLKQAHHHIISSTVLVSTDNTPVVAYLGRQGRTHSPDLCLEVWNTLIWCHQNKTCLAMRHIPGKFNILAGHLSRRNKLISTEWSFNQSIANAIFHITNFPNIQSNLLNWPPL